jgi:hypothetical protein
MSASPSRSVSPGDRSLRQRIEASSRPVIVRLHRMPRMIIPLVTVLLFAIGALAPVPYALVALALAFVFIAWIGYLSWPAVTGAGRLMRLAMLGLIVVLGVTRLS